MTAADVATRRYATLTFLRGALVALVITLLAGFLGALHYVPNLSPTLDGAGLGFTALRPLHTTFAAAWIFLGALTVVHRFLEDRAGPVTTGERWRLRALVILWASAGAAIVCSLLLGITSGREYMGFHPLISVPILLGWLLFAWSFFRAVWTGFWSQPIYVTMWGVAIPFFVVTFVEQHAWLLPGVFADPVVDIRVQWKACGTLVGSFNLLVYGSLYYVGERLSGDERYAHSRTAYALFFVGLLNSFTNFAHHTYHLPQSEAIKWISFLISMTEVVILVRVLWDLAGAVTRRWSPFQAPRFFVDAARWWTAAVLAGAIVISIPPLNSLVHGTHAVMAHAMGSMIGIDTMILLAGVTWTLGEMLRRRGEGDARLHTPGARRYALGFNVACALLFSWLTLTGLVTGVTRYQGLPAPSWVSTSTPWALVSLGGLAALCLTALLRCWLGAVFPSLVSRPCDAELPAPSTMT